MASATSSPSSSSSPTSSCSASSSSPSSPAAVGATACAASGPGAGGGSGGADTRGLILQLSLRSQLRADEALRAVGGFTALEQLLAPMIALLGRVPRGRRRTLRGESDPRERGAGGEWGAAARGDGARSSGGAAACGDGDRASASAGARVRRRARSGAGAGGAGTASARERARAHAEVLARVAAAPRLPACLAGGRHERLRARHWWLLAAVVAAAGAELEPLGRASLPALLQDLRRLGLPRARVDRRDRLAALGVVQLDRSLPRSTVALLPTALVLVDAHDKGALRRARAGEVAARQAECGGTLEFGWGKSQALVDFAQVFAAKRGKRAVREFVAMFEPAERARTAAAAEHGGEAPAAARGADDARPSWSAAMAAAPVAPERGESPSAPVCEARGEPAGAERPHVPSQGGGAAGEESGADAGSTTDGAARGDAGADPGSDAGAASHRDPGEHSGGDPRGAAVVDAAAEAGGAAGGGGGAPRGGERAAPRPGAAEFAFHDGSQPIASRGAHLDTCVRVAAALEHWNERIRPTRRWAGSPMDRRARTELVSDLQALEAYEAAATDPLSLAIRSHQLDVYEALALRVLLRDRVESGPERRGLPFTTLADTVQLGGIAGLERMQRAFGAEGVLVQAGVVERLGQPGSPRARLSLAEPFFVSLLDGVAAPELFGASGGSTDDEEVACDDDEDDDDDGLPAFLRSRRKRDPWPVQVIQPGTEPPFVLEPAARARFDTALADVELRHKLVKEHGYAQLFPYGTGSTFLFEGKPGTGKTLAARVIAARLGKPLIEVPMTDLLSRWVGGTEQAIRKVFAFASKKDAVLLLDEADSLLRKRSEAVRGWEVSQVNALLTAIERHAGVVVLTTNFVESLDVALERRLALRLEFTPPGPHERARLWQDLLGPLPQLAPDVAVAAVAARYELTGGQIKNAVLKLAAQALRSPGQPLGWAEVDEAVRTVLGSDAGRARPIGFGT